MRLRAFVVVAAVVVVAVVVGAPLALGERFGGRDATRVLVPSFCSLSDPARTVLDPLRGDGPVLEDPQSLFFVPEARVLAAVLSPESAASAFTWLWLVLSAPATAYLAASFGARRRGQAIAAITQALAGTTIDLVLHGSFVVEAALVPLAWGGARNLRRRGQMRARDVCAIALGLGLLGVHGHPQMALVAGILVVAEAIAAFVTRARVRVLYTGASAFAGTLCASLQLAASTGLGAAVQRAHGVESTTTWPLEMPEVIGVLLPVVAYKRVDVGASIVTAWHHDIAARGEWNATPFLGALAFSALIACVFARRTRPLFVVAIVAALFAVGAHTPAYPIATTLFPPFALFRYPAKYFEITSLCAAVAAGVVVEGAIRASTVRARLRIVLVVIATALLITAIALFIERDAIDAAAHAVSTHAPFDLPTLSSTLIAAALTSFAFATIGALALMRPRIAKWMPIVVVAEVCAFAIGALPTSPPVFDVERPLQSLPRGSEVCVGRSVGAVHVDVNGTDPRLWGDSIADVVDNKPNVGACGGPAFPDDYLPSSQHTVVQMSRYLLDETQGVVGPARALGCTHLVSRANVAKVAELTRVDLPNPSPFASTPFAIADPIPDASVAVDPRVVDDEHVLLDTIVASHTAHDVLALVDDPAHTLASHALPAGHDVTHVVATFASATDGDVRVDGSGGGVVVLRRSWWPGWRATQAGTELPVVRVAGRELGIVVDDVTHGPITLHYRVQRLSLAIALFAIGLGVLAVVVVIVRRSRAITVPETRRPAR